MKVGVVVFPGSNCDHDAWYAINRNLNRPGHSASAEFIWHDASSVGQVDAVILPGGFSYGDYLRCGAIARFSPVMPAVKKFAADGGLVLGICNGFQILVEAGLLPGALIRNAALKFVCRDVNLTTVTTNSPFTSQLERGQLLRLPVAHGEGQFIADEKTLDQLEANGETDTPDFTIQVGGHPFPLHVKYRALIDGTNGDTRLENIDAWFLNSYLHAVGAVLDGPKGEKGRTVSLDVAMDKSRIEDIMKMAVKSASPPMVGALKLNTKFLLPPGDNDVVDRLRLDGQFWIMKARFTNYDVQGKIEELSKRARGKTAEPAKERVASDFQGRFKLGSARLLLPDVSFDVPGARVELAGHYALKAETLDFKGQLLLDAKISQTVTGWRSLLLKVVDPLFKQKDGSGSAIPIKIGGSRSAPDFGLDMHRVLRRGDD